MHDRKNKVNVIINSPKKKEEETVVYNLVQFAL